MKASVLITIKATLIKIFRHYPSPFRRAETHPTSLAVTVMFLPRGGRPSGIVYKRCSHKPSPKITLRPSPPPRRGCSSASSRGAVVESSSTIVEGPQRSQPSRAFPHSTRHGPNGRLVVNSNGAFPFRVVGFGPAYCLRAEETATDSPPHSLFPFSVDGPRVGSGGACVGEPTMRLVLPAL